MCVCTCILLSIFIYLFEIFERFLTAFGNSLQLDALGALFHLIQAYTNRSIHTYIHRHTHTNNHVHTHTYDTDLTSNKDYIQIKWSKKCSTYMYRNIYIYIHTYIHTYALHRHNHTEKVNLSEKCSYVYIYIYLDTHT
jgi:hypothetical protein